MQAGTDKQVQTSRYRHRQTVIGAGICAEKGLWLYKASESIEEKV